MAERTTWRLHDWTFYFKKTETMTEAEKAVACVWLEKNDYPVPADCPKNNTCPLFRPICLFGKQCYVARNMCELLTGEVKCSCCKSLQKVSELKDAKAVAEFHISGLCQVCQDKVFGNGRNH